MPGTVYLESTIISYLAARPSRDLVLAAHQSVTRDWWESDRMRYRCVVSTEVVREIASGDSEAVQRRLALIAGIPVLPVTDEALEVARTILGMGALPHGMASDALHLAVAVSARLDYLLTWNCRHLANGQILRQIEREARRHGWVLPTVCTPLELEGGPPSEIE